MNTINKLLTVYTLMKAKLFRIRKPLVVNWAITYRCNRSCSYCGVKDVDVEELSTPQILSFIDEMLKLKTKMIHFTGGEPLLREDMHLILKYCREKGISIGLNSNGSLVPQKIKSLNAVDLLSLSLDGPEEIHDTVRGSGSYREVMEAIRLARENNIKTRFITVLSKLNLDSVDFILNKAEEFNSIVVFQPATRLRLESSTVNPIAAPVEKYRQIILRLISEKHRNEYIGNSVSGLRHLYNWPGPKAISCVNGLIVCRIEPNGILYGCADYKKTINAVDCKVFNFKEAFSNLKPVRCEGCWCASYVELNCLFSLKLDTIFNIKRLI